MTSPDKISLPKSKLSIFFQWLAGLSFVTSIVFVVVGLWIGYLYDSFPGDGESAKELRLSGLSSFYSELGYFALTITFYGALLLIGVQIVKRLDALLLQGQKNSTHNALQ